MAIFTKKIDEDLPLSLSAFGERVGDDPVRINHATVVAASDVLAHVDVETVETTTDFHRAIGRAMRAGSGSTTPSDDRSERRSPE